MTAVKERPILFSGPMVRAILSGAKTQTRRIVRGVNSETELAPDFTTSFPEHGMDAVRFEDGHAVFEYQTGIADTREYRVRCPFGKIGDCLWVRETWRDRSVVGHSRFHGEQEAEWIEYRADRPSNDRTGLRWRPSIHMPRRVSRIILEITGVRVERLQDISEQDAWAEGFPDPDGRNREYPDRARYWFKTLWGEINGIESWAANPWVWVIEFKRIEGGV